MFSQRHVIEVCYQSRGHQQPVEPTLCAAVSIILLIGTQHTSAQTSHGLFDVAHCAFGHRMQLVTTKHTQATGTVITYAGQHVLHNAQPSTE
jgi:hypothetical protein